MLFCKKNILISLGLLSLLGCSQLERVTGMMTAEDFKKNIEKEIRTIDDVVILFPKTVEQVRSYAKFSLENTQKALHALLAIKSSERTFDNTARMLDRIGRNMGIEASIISVLEMVHPDKNMRDACHEEALKTQQYLVEAFHDKALYQALKDLDTPETKKTLTQTERYYLEEAIRDFERDGLNLPQEQLDKVIKINQEIAEISLNFATNVAQDKSFITVDPKDLPGVDEAFLENLKKDEQGNYIVRCDYPTYTEIIEYCSCEQTRKKLFFAFNNRAFPQNDQLLKKLIEKRHELAQLLGFKTFAALNIDTEMAKNAERVESFLLDLAQKSTPKAKKEIELLAKELPNGTTLDAQGRFDPWSLPYVKACYKKKHLEIDEHEISEYFPVEKTLDGVFAVYQKFLGLNFSISKPVWAWHEDVRLIEVHDASTGILRGYLFIDLYPRDDKYSHACLDPIISTLKDTKTSNITPSVALIIANFPRSTQEKPALLKFDDVQTFFHEFGHAMHNLLGSTELAAHSGTEVKTDFVEMPSQMFEEWLYDKTVLQQMSCHYKTKQPLPDILIDKMIKLKQFDSGMFVLRQSMLALYALKLFSNGTSIDPQKLWQELAVKYTPMIRFEPDTHFYASFGHLASDTYASKYYNYLWAKVLALDVFYKVKTEGLLDASVGRSLVEKILGKGGSVDPDILLKDYLGRESNSDAFLKDLGIN